MTGALEYARNMIERVLAYLLSLFPASMLSDPVAVGSVEDIGSDDGSDLIRGKLPVRVLGTVMLSGWMRWMMC